MADRVEREIEEILARLDKELPSDGGGATPERQPISITSARDVRAQKVKAEKSTFGEPKAPRFTAPFEPPTLLIAGAIVMILGLILSTAIASVFIWLSFAGVLLFLAAFAWSFFRSKPASASSGAVFHSGEPGKVFWRDRYIDARPGASSTTDKIRRRFRR